MIEQFTGIADLNSASSLARLLPRGYSHWAEHPAPRMKTLLPLEGLIFRFQERSSGYGCGCLSPCLKTIGRAGIANEKSLSPGRMAYSAGITKRNSSSPDLVVCTRRPE